MKQDQWVLVSDVCKTPGAEGITVYGVRVVCLDGSAWTWPDVDVDRRVVERLVAVLQTAQPEPCHYADVVLDFIQRQAEYRG